MKRAIRKKWWLHIVAAMCALVITLSTEKPTTAGGDGTFPKLANYYLSGGAISEEEARSLARWDLVITGFEVPYESPSEFALLQRLNPSLILLPYLNSISRHENFPVQDPQNPRYQQRLRSRDEWLLKSAGGKPMGFWPGAQIMNPTNFAPRVDDIRWNEYVGNYGAETLSRKQGWDGVYFDDAMATISWLNHGIIDINNDGRDDTAEYVDKRWQEGMQQLFRHAREQIGSSAIFVTNSSNTYQQYTNGRLYEAAFRSTEDWKEELDQINSVLGYPGSNPRIVIVNATTNNDGNWQDWRRMRFAYTSTLMTDAYFSYDFGDKWHQQLWWYDEYDAELGVARGNAYELPIGAWRRDFLRGIAIVNPTSHNVTVDLGDTFQRINGVQDRTVNSGEAASSVTLPPHDGIVLMRANIAAGDTLRWSKGALTLLRNGVVQWTMYPYDNRWKGSVSMDVGDIDGDRDPEIVLAAGPGGGPHIRIVSNNGRLKGPGFFAYDKKRRTGASVTLADVNNDGLQDIVVSSGREKMREVKVFDYRGNVIPTRDATERYQPFLSVENLVFDKGVILVQD